MRSERYVERLRELVENNSPSLVDADTYITSTSYNDAFRVRNPLFARLVNICAIFSRSVLTSARTASVVEWQESWSVSSASVSLPRTNKMLSCL